ncbi:MAG: transposase [Planctomycetaceae bacterium]|nr:transposase [Planctomycetaceae bacterium]
MSHKPIIAYHCVLSMYGFWLPNDPRGSGSDSVRTDWIQPFGKAMKTTGKHSVAHLALSEEQKQKQRDAKKALMFPPVKLNGEQALAVIQGFTEVIDFDVYACSIMPEHMHIVIGQVNNIDDTVKRLKTASDRMLTKAERFPEATAFNGETRLTIWGDGYWKRFIYDDADLAAVIKYVEDNPVKDGKKPQRWRFVKNPFEGIF